MRVNEKIERITDKTIICGIDIGKTMCCARFCDYRGLEVYKTVWFDKTKDMDIIGCQITAAMHQSGKTDVIVSFEPTGHYWLNVWEYFQKCNIETVLMPTYTVKQAKGIYDQDPTKSDPKDAMLIARLTSEGKYVKPIEREELFQNIYSGYHIYCDIQKEINRIKNKIHVWNDKYFPEIEHVYTIDSVGVKAIYKNQLIPTEINEISEEAFIEIMTKENSRAKKASISKIKELCKKSNGIKVDAFTKLEIKRLYERYEELEKELKEMKEKLKELASQIDYVEKLVEISGVDYMGVVGVIAETGDLKNYESPKQILKMAGLSLKESSSGQKKGKKHISKRGRSKLRYNLKQIIIPLLRNNNFFLQLHNYYITEREHPLTKLISINALIRKFVGIMLAIVKTGESFSEEKAMKESCIFSC